jgi:hypothetical protein
MLLRLIEDGKPEIFQQQIYGLPVIIARIDAFSDHLSDHKQNGWTERRWKDNNLLYLGFYMSFSRK